jgi:hypothetical protein
MKPFYGGCSPSAPDRRDLTLQTAPPVKPVSEAWDLLAAGGISPAGQPTELVGPPRSDMSKYVTRCEDQGYTYDCVGYAWSYALELLWQKSEGKSRQLDPRFIVEHARWYDGRADGSTTSVRSGLRSLMTFGAPPICVPEDSNAARRFALASHYRIDGYWRLDKPVNEWGAVDHFKSIVEARVLLSCNCPVVVGFFIFDEAQTGPDGIIHLPADYKKNYGGHCVCLVGHDDTLDCGRSGIGAVKLINSWGPAWGQHGFGWLPYEYFKRAYAWDCWGATVGTWRDNELE